jgi:RHS repeat-associated protein
VNANVTALLDTSGNVVERVLYDAYGKHALFQSNWTTSQASTVYANEVLFASYRLNPETGMYQVRHREYHPTLGRWVQRDPVGYHDGMNLYEYVGSNPIIGLDPKGLFTFTGNSSDSLGIRPGTASAPFGAARYGYMLMNYSRTASVYALLR